MTISYQDTPNGTRISITMGDVNGTIEKIVEIGPFGSLMTVAKPTYIPKMSGNITGNINCCVSVSLSTAAPIAANKELY